MPASGSLSVQGTLVGDAPEVVKVFCARCRRWLRTSSTDVAPRMLALHLNRTHGVRLR